MTGPRGRCSGPGRSARSVPEPLIPLHSGPRLPGSLPGPGSGHLLVPVRLRHEDGSGSSRSTGGADWSRPVPLVGRPVRLRSCASRCGDPRRGPPTTWDGPTDAIAHIAYDTVPRPMALCAAAGASTGAGDRCTRNNGPGLRAPGPGLVRVLRLDGLGCVRSMVSALHSQGAVDHERARRGGGDVYFIR